jgi:hypothetical protein
MQVENIADMQPGDFIQLPRGKWHVNAAAKAVYAEAQQYAADHPGTQFQVENEPDHNARLERIK